MNDFAKYCKNRPATVREMLINLLKHPIPQWWERGRSDPESVSGFRSTPKINHFLRFTLLPVPTMFDRRLLRRSWVNLLTNRTTDDVNAQALVQWWHQQHKEKWGGYHWARWGSTIHLALMSPTNVSDSRCHVNSAGPMSLLCHVNSAVNKYNNRL